ncbi:septum formation initiator family protein [Mesonia sp. K7]|uniref:FtsB family cell division protein n=1 Tax=Mesonia sp. K7 TaxID=2218606 RepID=UPI000DA91C8A|nr:septum formation initiator family protein [Mesonia sp. K7]PZD78273.1 septum formation initiator family protein [Mesonia sp. K7]
MNLKKVRNNKWFKFFTNKYILVLLVFGVWMLFLDSNSWLVHNELDQEINELENNKKYYRTEIKRDQQVLESLNDSNKLEKYAREKYYMKRENEDVYIIEFDSSQTKK